MQEPPYDRPLALASLVRTMKDHYLDVRCSCGANRVIALARMADNPRVASCTLAHVALRIVCSGCHDGPDEVHLTATIQGIGPAPNPTISLVWTMPLVQRPSGGAKRRRAPLGSARA